MWKQKSTLLFASQKQNKFSILLGLRVGGLIWAHSEQHGVAGEAFGTILFDWQHLLRRGPRLDDEVTSIIEYRQGQLHAENSNKKSWSPKPLSYSMYAFVFCWCALTKEMFFGC